MVLDNLKAEVLRPDLYEPKLNPLYAALLAHYLCLGVARRGRSCTAPTTSHFQLPCPEDPRPGTILGKLIYPAHS
jgi:hypothetical protein